MGLSMGYPASDTEPVARVNAQWRDWLRRRMEVEGRGERFDEPPPSGDAPGDGAG